MSLSLKLEGKKMNLQPEHWPKEIPSNFNGQIFSTKKNSRNTTKRFPLHVDRSCYFPKRHNKSMFPGKFLFSVRISVVSHCHRCGEVFF